jgi:hypothetical protein
MDSNNPTSSQPAKENISSASASRGAKMIAQRQDGINDKEVKVEKALLELNELKT